MPPMFHLADAWAIWTVTAAGGVHVMLPRFDADVAWSLMDGAGVTITNLVPAMIPGLLEASQRRGRPPRGLRVLLSGGAPIAPRVVSRIVEILGCEYVQTYGLTETSPFLTFSLLDETLRRLPPEEQLRLRARTGRAARGIELRVVLPAGAETFHDVPSDDTTVGEVIVRGATVTPGYWRNETATREAFLGGWFHTGDLGTIDARGFLNLVDRAKDVIVTGGESVYCSEVEAALHEHAAVVEAAVFGVPDDTWGEAVRAAVVLSTGFSPEGGDAAGGREMSLPHGDRAKKDPGVGGTDDDSRSRAGVDLIAFCRARLAAYKCPRAIDVVAALPRTGSGKTDKKALREPFWRGRDRRIH